MERPSRTHLGIAAILASLGVWMIGPYVNPLAGILILALAGLVFVRGFNPAWARTKVWGKDAQVPIRPARQSGDAAFRMARTSFAGEDIETDGYGTVIDAEDSKVRVKKVRSRQRPPEPPPS